ncbi:hypothetical protein HY632_03385 [Candidatus Uhrbacteria bacterium]|nr:hypothetical protein [Candidatus Uhrbacteria bacterium]
MRCDSCGPTPTPHGVEWFVNIITDALDVLDRIGFRLRVILGAPGRRIIIFLRDGFLRIGALLHAVQWEEVTPSHALASRMRFVVERVRAMGYTVQRLRFLGSRTHVFRASGSERCVRYWEILPRGRTRIRECIIDDKALVKRVLERAGIPVPVWRLVRTVRRACGAAREVGYPVVVKPRSGSLSRHTVVGVCDDAALVAAVRSARMLDWKVLIEEQLMGDVYRATVVDGACVAICRRVPPNVTGDGQQTISALIVARNADPRRGVPGDAQSTLHQFPTDAITASVLGAHGRTLASIPAAGERVLLHEKVTLGYGCDIEDVTDDAHPETRALFERIARVLGADLVGIDFIASDIRCSWRAQRCGVIECNSLPSIDMHHFPTQGPSRDVAGALVRVLLLGR